MKPKVYLDTDILMDYLYAREPFFKDSVEIISLIESGKIKGYISSLIIWNLYYLLTKALGEKSGRDKIKKFRSLIDIIAIDGKIIDMGLNSKMKDFEDAIQYYVAKSEGVKYLVTRNKKDYLSQGLTVLTPKELLHTLKEIL